MAYMKDCRPGSEGNTRLLKQYGGGSTPPRQSYAKGYATGGAVKGGNPSLGEGLSAAGGPSKPSLARPGRKMPGKSKKASGKTNINVVVMAPKGDDKPMPPMADAGGPPMMPPGPPGGPPMPMRAHGGRVKRADGGPTPGEQMADARKRRDDAESDRNSRLSNTAMNAGATAALAGVPGKFGKFLKYGNAALAASGALGAASSQGKKSAAEAEMKRLGEGKAKDGEEDRKHGGKVCRAPGGPVGGLSNKQGGAGGASGRLAKVRMYGK